ncbi:lysophosphatidic acid receptor 1-A-like [Polyodon spathula]|uniref:lysophosphatidic acid receptor 1-A-like n=1 Tax=Polyodon spathula TaxID=7913 RepID=UPI001B7F50B2|nr:lysophosphatidic acid receptor 1-A-like [Polyodon spathula]
MNCTDANTTDPWSSELVLALGIFQVLTNLTAVACNCAVIVTILHGKHFRRPIYILFCSLASSDLLTSISGLWVSLLFIEKPESTIYGSEDLLRVYSMNAIGLLATIYNLMSIGIERYLTVSSWANLRFKVSKRQSLTAVLVNWGLALLLGSLPLLGWNCSELGMTSNLYNPLCIDYLVFITVPTGMVAFGCIFVTYVAIIAILKKQKTRLAAHDFPNNKRPTYRPAEDRVTRTSIAIWILTAVSYLPFFVGVLWDACTAVCPQKLKLGVFIFRNVASVMFTVNAIGNPIIYTLKAKNFRSALNSLRCASKDNRVHVRTVEGN